MDPSNAAQKSTTIKPETSLETSQNKKALIMKVNSPSVSKLIGSVNSINIGFINILTRPITNEAHKAAAKPAILIPGTAQATKINAKAKSIHLISKYSILFPLMIYTI